MEPTQPCPNCGLPRNGAFCSHCGQSDRVYARGLGPVLWELVREAFEVDSRLLRTVGLLFLKPGALAAEFSRNRRARYMTPVRVYLFASVLLGIMLSLTTLWSLEVPAEYQEELDEVVAQIPLDSLPRPDEGEIAAFKALLESEQAGKLDDILARPEGSFTALIAGILVSGADDSIPVPGNEGAGSQGLLGRMFTHSFVDLLHDPAAFSSRFLGNVPVAMFLLLPFYALLLAGCYRRKRRFFVEHLVFGMHVQAFTFVVLGALLLLPATGWTGWLRLALALWAIVYALVAMKRYYGGGWRATLFKGALVGGLYGCVLIPCVALGLFLAA